MSFGRLRQRIGLKCVPHVQHDYFSSFNQSEHCFLASSLPLPSSLLKPPKGLAPVVQTVDNAIHRINHYPLDIAIGFAITYPVDSDLSGG